MSAVDLCVFLTSYTLVVGFVAVAELLRSRRASSLVTVVVALLAIMATTVVGFYLKPGDSYFGLLWFLVGERDFSAVVSLGLGVAAALVWVTRLTDRTDFSSDDVRRRTIQHRVAQVVLAASIIGVVLCSQAFIWKEIRGIQRDPAVRMHAPGFIIEKIAKLSFPPIRVAVNDDKAYVSYDYFQNAGVMGGGIIELSEDEATGKFHQKIVADSPLLMRGYGLVARNGELFVSRSGICSKATQGTIQYEPTGAVTQLRDVDGDGYFEFAHDVVTGLPGVRGPETMHQNNGICFDTDGSLFVAVASSANRALDDHPWGGTVLRVNPDFTQPEIFARGFRNPFGIMVGPDNELFITDNDADENPGDELNHLVRGAHYGHPYVVPNESSVETAGFRDPILVGEHEWNFLGMTYATSDALPEAYRDCIYVADFMQHTILRLKLERSGDTYQVTTVDTFASISSPVDIAVTSSGEFFVVSRHTKNVYRIRPRDAASGGSNE
jgi:glucose/arabinose dehydrogenase